MKRVHELAGGVCAECASDLLGAVIPGKAAPFEVGRVPVHDRADELVPLLLGCVGNHHVGGIFRSDLHGVGRAIVGVGSGGEQRLQSRNHAGHDRLTRRRIFCAKIVERLLQQGQTIDVAAIHLDEGESRFRSELGLVAITPDDGDQADRSFDRPFPLLDIAAIDFAACKQHERRRTQREDLRRPTHPTPGAIPLGSCNLRG